MRLLVLGANGLLGSNAVHAGRDAGWTVEGTYHSTPPGFDIPTTQLDIRNDTGFRKILDRFDPAVVVNAAAMTDVDACEDEPEQAHAVNATAPGKLANHCAKHNTKFVHVSTDYVFDGTDDTPYSEDAELNPIQVYGETKLAGERAVRVAMEDGLIVRLSFVYGIHRGRDALTGFPAWVRNRLDQHEPTPLFTDQHITPSRAGQAAATILELARVEASGTYHVAAQSCVTPYEFGQALCERMNGDASLLEQGSQEDIERSATRPSNTCLDVSKVESKLDRSQPALAVDLAKIEEWL